MKKIILMLTCGLLSAGFTLSTLQDSALAGPCPFTNREIALLRAAVSWKELYFQGGKGFTRLAATLRLRSPCGFCPSGLEQVMTGFMPCPLERPNIQVLSVETALFSLIPPREEYCQHVWFEPETGRVLQRIRIKKGYTPWIKAYRWSENGVRRLRVRPKHPSEVNSKPGKWKGRHSSFYPYSSYADACPVISEPTVLFHILSRIDTKNTQFPLELCVFGKKKLHRITIRLMKLEPLKVSFESYSFQGSRRIEKKVTPAVFFITEEQPGEKSRETFSLLGLRDEIFIFMDPASHLPVRIMGKTKKFGHVILALTGAWLK